MQESIVFLLRVQCRRKESSRSLSHLLMNFLFLLCGRREYKYCHCNGVYWARSQFWNGMTNTSFLTLGTTEKRPKAKRPFATSFWHPHSEKLSASQSLPLTRGSAPRLVINLSSALAMCPKPVRSKFSCYSRHSLKWNNWELTVTLTVKIWLQYAQFLPKIEVL